MSLVAEELMLLAMASEILLMTFINSVRGIVVVSTRRPKVTSRTTERFI